MNEQQMNNIDERLSSESQIAMSNVVKSLPDDSLSMAWRSQLNERVLADHARFERKRRFWVFARPAMAAVAAASLAVVFIRRTPTPSVVQRPAGSVEQTLIQAHVDTSQGMDVAGIGLTPDEVDRFASNAVAPNDEYWRMDEGYF